jgi:hypothetical protein
MLILCLGWMLGSCSSPGNKLPIPKDDMTDILTEIHIGQGYFDVLGIQNPKWQDSIPYNRHVVEVKGYSWAEFDSTLTLISAEPKLFEEIYGKVIDRLKAMETETPKTLQDTLLSVGSLLYPMHLGRGPYERFVRYEGPGTYTFYARILVYPQDQMTSPVFSVEREIAGAPGKMERTSLGHLNIRKWGQQVEYRVQRTLNETGDGGFTLSIFDKDLRSLQDTTWTQYAEISSLYVIFEPLPAE